MTRKPKRIRVVLVEWADSCTLGTGIWTYGALPEDYEPALLVSTGFLVKDTDKVVVLASGVSTSGDMTDGTAQLFAIPRGCVKRMRYLT